MEGKKEGEGRQKGGGKKEGVQEGRKKKGRQADRQAERKAKEGRCKGRNKGKKAIRKERRRKEGTYGRYVKSPGMGLGEPAARTTGMGMGDLPLEMDRRRRTKELNAHKVGKGEDKREETTGKYWDLSPCGNG
jgi:hypothetical protein